jgi:hypothetical protein
MSLTWKPFSLLCESSSMKFVAYGLMAVGVLLSTYGGYSLWFARGDWLELGLGAAGVIMAVAGVGVNRILSQPASS